MIIYYSMTWFWNEKFEDYFYCINTGSFLTKSFSGDVIVACKCVSVLSTSFAINTFFYLSLDNNDRKTVDELSKF